MKVKEPFWSKVASRNIYLLCVTFTIKDIIMFIFVIDVYKNINENEIRKWILNDFVWII